MHEGVHRGEAREGEQTRGCVWWLWHGCAGGWGLAWQADGRRQGSRAEWAAHTQCSTHSPPADPARPGPAQPTDTKGTRFPAAALMIPPSLPAPARAWRIRCRVLRILAPGPHPTPSHPAPPRSACPVLQAELRNAKEQQDAAAASNGVAAHDEARARRCGFGRPPALRDPMWLGRKGRGGRGRRGSGARRGGG